MQTKIWKFESRLDSLIEYAISGEKTEHKLYVSGINCMPDTAFYEMKNIKKQFLKTGGIECFHAVQSFAEKEVTSEQAYEIGVELAEEIRLCDYIQSRIDKIKIYELHQKLREERQKAEKQEKSNSKNKYRDR